MDEPKLHLAHILVKNQYEAEDILRKIKEGVAFSELAQRFSNCPSGRQGGDLGVMALSRLDATFAEASAKLDANQISEVVQTRFGYHLIKRL